MHTALARSVLSGYVAYLMQCFISYAHADYKACGRLVAHLAHVAQAFGFSCWLDKRIKAGNYWSAKIEAEIGRSDIFVLAVTNDFLGSNYIFNHELPAIIERHRHFNALLIPIILRPSGWQRFFGGYIQALPADERGGDTPRIELVKTRKRLCRSCRRRGGVGC